MVPQSQATLKSYFETGDKPSQAQFAEVIDTMFWYINDLNARTAAAEQAAADAARAAATVLLKASFAAGTKTWNISDQVRVASVVVVDPQAVQLVHRVTFSGNPFANANYKLLLSHNYPEIGSLGGNQYLTILAQNLGSFDVKCTGEIQNFVLHVACFI